MFSPVINDALSEHKNNTILAISKGFPTLLTGCCNISEPSNFELVVSIHPGEMELTLTRPDNDTANACVNACIPPLLAV